MEAKSGERTASYSKLNDWNQASSTRPPFTARSTNLSRWKFIFVVLTIASCIVFIGLGIGFGINKINQKSGLRPLELSGTEVYREAAVSSQTPICSQAGKDILLQGGSAVDAAIAALLCEGVYSPQSTGLGGGFFMTVYTKSDGKVSVIDARETAPRNATKDMFKDKGTSSKHGGLAVAVPGELRGFELAHQRYGRLNWTDLFVPAIKMCRQGVKITKRTADTLKDRVADCVYEEPSMSAVYVSKETGELVQAGDVILLPELARTLEIVASKGASELYTGKLAKELVADLEKFGSIITLQDLADYKALEREPVFVTLKDGVTVYGVPPPGSGFVLGLLLNILDRYDFNSSSTDTEEKETLVYHRFIEACKFAYAKRSNLGDPDFSEGAIDFTESPSTQELTDQILSLINDQRTFEPKHYHNVFAFKPDHGTAHVSVLAANGDAVSATSTVNLWFGACIRSNSTGILLNNEMDDFSVPNQENFYGFQPSPQNFIAPQKRAASSMSPSIALDANKNFLYSFGASGGSKIISTDAFVYMALHYFGMSGEDATKLARIHHQLIPNIVEYESDVPQYVLEGLKQKGHDLRPMSWPAAMYLIAKDAEGKIHASSDTRRQSRPAGY